MGELELQSMTEREAERLTERIRITAHNYAEARQKLYDLVQEAKAGNAHLALGYKSWSAYLSDVLGEEPMRLARGERQEMVRMLSDEGMSTRAIAPIVGASDITVRRDMQATATNVGVDAPPAPRTVESLDGRTRTYTPPPAQLAQDPHPTQGSPPTPKRRPITDQARDAGVELRKAVERLQRIEEDDRYNAKKQDILEILDPYIDFTINTLTDIRS